MFQYIPSLSFVYQFRSLLLHVCCNLIHNDRDTPLPSSLKHNATSRKVEVPFLDEMPLDFFNLPYFFSIIMALFVPASNRNDYQNLPGWG
jgi:hypothetical protein